ncbi:trehalose-phosphatase [Microbacterium koreense]|uniref:Trehalose 6-phosphate phosphatase n=1 Tax=Microbacterium koreense TaxID=323761 RepID=A0ABW2ZRJ6_9MICO
MSGGVDRHTHIVRIADTEHLLVALDFDGTLAPLVDEPMTARMTRRARAAVERLDALPETTVALVSGRNLHDLRAIAEHTDDSPYLLAGSHGAEFWFPESGVVDSARDGDEERRRDTLRTRVEEVVADLPGVWIEPKAFGFALHTRLATADIAETVRGTVDELMTTDAAHWRRRTGKGVVEYAFRHEGKDSAIAALRAHTRATAVFFAGDDVTDEDALASLGSDDLGVRVGDATGAASVFVADVEDLASLLEELATVRARARQ